MKKGRQDRIAETLTTALIVISYLWQKVVT